MVTLRLGTPRLELRELSPSDVEALVYLDSDPEVMRYLTGGRPTSRTDVERQVATYIEQYQRFPGLGRWAAELRGSRQFVGWLSLAPARGGREAELGFRLARAYWHQGLATEGAKALVAEAIGILELDWVFAQTMAVNVASRNVMERAGLRYVRTFHQHFEDPIPGTEYGEVEYELRREDWPLIGE